MPRQTDNAAYRPREAGWYVWDYLPEFGPGGVQRGPYATAEMAGAVRTEMERHGDERNLWIVDNETVDRWEADIRAAS